MTAVVEENEPPWRSALAGWVSTCKDLTAVLRDGLLLAIAILLLTVPGCVNAILKEAGFTEGNFIGLKWQSQLFDNNAALTEAKGTIDDLQKKNDELVRALADANAKLNDASSKAQFAVLDKANAELKSNAQLVQRSVSQTIASNTPFVEKALQSPVAHAAVPTRSRSDYLVGLQTLGLSDDERQALNGKISAAGYRLHDLSASYAATGRPSWFADRSTVFYYGASGLPAANELARVLKDLVGQEFAVRRGSGLGVDPSQRDVTLFVHFVKG